MVQLFLASEPTQAIHATSIPLEDRETNNLPLRRGSTTATAEATAEARGELAGGTTLLGLLLAAAVATLTGSAGTALTVLTAEHAAGRSVGALLLDVGSRDNLSGEVEPLAEVIKTLEKQKKSDTSHFEWRGLIVRTYLGGEGVVVVLPRELGLDVAAGVQGLQGLDHL